MSLLTFVKNRCSNIKKRTLATNVHWLPGSDNPADIGTRKVSTQRFLEDKLWFAGPEFLSQGKESWPKEYVPSKTKAAMAEVKKQELVKTHVC